MSEMTLFVIVFLGVIVWTLLALLLGRLFILFWKRKS